MELDFLTKVDTLMRRLVPLLQALVYAGEPFTKGVISWYIIEGYRRVIHSTGNF